MKKLTAGLAAVLLTALFAGYLVPFEGPWVDRAVSGYLSSKFRADVRMTGSRISRWSSISFSSVSFGKSGGGRWADSGPGEARRVRFGEAIRVSDLAFSGEIARRFTMLSSLLPDGGRGLWSAREVRAVVTRRRGAQTLHLLRWKSEHFLLRGGIRFLAGKAVKAHALLLFPRPFLESLPGEVRSRLRMRPDGSGELRLTYAGSQIALAGAGGVMLKARWQGSA